VVEVTPPESSSKPSWWERRGHSKQGKASRGAPRPETFGASTASAGTVAAGADNDGARHRGDGEKANATQSAADIKQERVAAHGKEWAQATAWLERKGYTVLKTRFGGDMVAVRNECVILRPKVADNAEEAEKGTNPAREEGASEVHNTRDLERTQTSRTPSAGDLVAARF